MGNLGGPEILVILLVALIVLGPNKLPDAARQVGKAMSELRRLSSGFQQEMREAMVDPEIAASTRSLGQEIKNEARAIEKELKSGQPSKSPPMLSADPTPPPETDTTPPPETDT